MSFIEEKNCCMDDLLKTRCLEKELLGMEGKVRKIFDSTESIECIAQIEIL